MGKRDEHAVDAGPMPRAEDYKTVTKSLDEAPMPIYGVWPTLAEKSALNKQIGGDHYSKYPLQPIEFYVANGFSYCQGAVMDYIIRYKDKGGARDLDKAIHVIEIMKELEYGDYD
jgi:hypothetical protein